MAIYNYIARDNAGAKRRGTVEGASEKEAVVLIRERGLFLTQLNLKHEQLSAFARFRYVAFADIVNFTRQLATMLTAGLQVQEALSLLKNQSNKTAVSDLIGKISREIQEGGNFASALSKHPKLFSRTYIALVKAGEASGSLEKILVRLADNLEKQQEFQSKVKQALIYPTIIVIAMFAVFAILMIVVVPKLTELYSDFGADLPLPTRILQGVSSFSVHFWWVILIGGFLGWNIFQKWRKTSIGRKIWDGFTLQLPLFGPLQKEIILVEFTRTLGMLVGAGVHILEALKILTESVGNVHYETALQEISKNVEKGFPLGLLFAQYPIFPAILSQMVKVGEETGKMDETLIKLSSYFEQESDHTVKGLTTAIEPVIMIVLGVGVGFIVFAIITPIYSLTSQFK